MLNSFSRREAVLGAIASLFGAVWRGRSAGAGQSGRAEDAAAGAQTTAIDLATADAPAPSATYSYDEHGRLLSATTAIDPRNTTSSAF